MPIFISLLRGINVSGKNLIKMEALRKSYAALGCEDVETYVQSGNVIFNHRAVSESALVKKLRGQILKDFKIDVPILVRTPEHLSTVIKANPWLSKKGFDPTQLYVTFLSETVRPADLTKMDRFVAPGELLKLSKREIYIYCPDGYGNTKLNNNNFEKAFSISATSRNWRTINELFQRAQTRGK